jgi:periplasmic protein TonB
MKKIFLLCLFFISQRAMSQDQETVVYVNKKGKEVKEKKADFLIQRLKVGSASWEINTYEIFGPMLSSCQTSDENGAIKNGRYTTYQNGDIDTSGFFMNNLRDSFWVIYGHTGMHRLLKKIRYKNGELISEKDSSAINREEKLRLDSIKLAHRSDKDSILKVEIESSFTGGDQAWQQFLRKNLRYPDRAINNVVQGIVIVLFVVNKDGQVEDASISRSVEYSLDRESLRIVRMANDWIPAMQNGRKVKSYKRQPLQFKLQFQR